MRCYLIFLFGLLKLILKMAFRLIQLIGFRLQRCFQRFLVSFRLCQFILIFLERMLRARIALLWSRLLALPFRVHVVSVSFATMSVPVHLVCLYSRRASQEKEAIDRGRWVVHRRLRSSLLYFGFPHWTFHVEELVSSRSILELTSRWYSLGWPGVPSDPELSCRASRCERKSFSTTSDDRTKELLQLDADSRSIFASDRQVRSHIDLVRIWSMTDSKRSPSGVQKGSRKQVSSLV